MFDIAISEIMIIAVVALIVLGPEKLPKTARTLGHLFGRLQRYVSDVKADINRELQLEELKKLQAEVKTAATDFQSSVSSVAENVQSNVRAVESDLNSAAGAGDVDVSTAVSPPVAATSHAEPLRAGPAGTEASGQASLPAPSAQAEPSRAGPAAAEAPRQGSLPGFDRG